MYAFQSRNTEKVHVKTMTTAAYIKPPVCMGYADAAKATITCQKTGPIVIVRINN